MRPDRPPHLFLTGLLIAAIITICSGILGKLNYTPPIAKLEDRHGVRPSP